MHLADFHMVFALAVITSSKATPTYNVIFTLAATGLTPTDAGQAGDPFVGVMLSDGKTGWKQLGKTEVLTHTLNPVWQATFHVHYKTESVFIRFDVEDEDHFNNQHVGDGQISLYNDILKAHNFQESPTDEESDEAWKVTKRELCSIHKKHAGYILVSHRIDSVVGSRSSTCGVGNQTCPSPSSNLTSSRYNVFVLLILSLSFLIQTVTLTKNF